MTFSRHPVLYLQGVSGTHTITFCMDTSGRDPVVAEHLIIGKLPAHLLSLEERDGDLFVMKGRKGLRCGLGVENVYPLERRVGGRVQRRYCRPRRRLLGARCNIRGIR